MSRPTLSLALANAGKSLALACLSFVAACPDSASAAYTLDRWYQMGDDILFSGGSNAENASNGAEVGSGNSLTGTNGAPITYDSAATNNDNFQALEAYGTNGLPTYAEYGVGGNPAAPLAAAASMNSYGIRFDGVDDYLAAVNLNDPSVAAPGSLVTYSGTMDRGFQLWVYPTDVDGVAEYVIDDADEHGFNITTAGFFLSEVRDNRINSPYPVEQDTWAHVMLVRDSVGLGGAAFYVNGLVGVTHTPDYDSNSVTNLLVGANAEDDAGTTQDPNVQSPPTFFSGIVDEIELFVTDDGSNYGAFDYTEDNGYFTDVWLPMQSGYGFTLNTGTGHNSQQWVKGDINFDGVFDELDVDAFVAGWLSKKADIAGTGPQVGDYESLALGDLDLDGDTDLGDWIRLRQYNLAAAAGLKLPSLSQLNAVPEPSSLMLAAAVSALMLGRCRGHWSAIWDRSKA